MACPGDTQPRPSEPPQPAPPTTEAAVDPTLRWAINEPTSIIPLNATTPDDLLVVDALFDSLTTWDEHGSIRPSVARRWVPTGSRQWLFVLRRDARFSDGTPVTAEHFVRTWNQLVLRGEAHHHLRDVVGYGAVRQGRARTLEGLRAVGTARLHVRLRRPVAEFPAVVGHPALAPMLNAARQNAATLDRPVGNGPFAMAEPWAHGRFVRVTRRVAAPPAGPGVPVQEVVFQIADPASAYIAYEQGGIDVARVPSGGLRERPESELRQRYRGPGLLRGDVASTYFLVSNHTRPPFNDVRVRRAVSLALDREQVIATAFEGNASPGASVIPPALKEGRRRVCLACSLSRARARRLFDRAGVTALPLWLSEGGEHEAVAKQVHDDLAAAGVRVRVRRVSFDRFLAAFRDRRPGLFRFGWTLDYPSAENALRPLLHSTAGPAAGGANYAGYQRRDVDELLDRAAATRSARRRTALYQRAEDRILRRDAAIVPVATLRHRIAVSNRVRGLTIDPLGRADLTTVRLTSRTAEEDA